MAYEITYRTGLARDALVALLENIGAGGPFAVAAPETCGVETWLLRIEPRHPDLAVGFAKVAEFQMLLARSGEVLAFTRTDIGSLAVAS